MLKRRLPLFISLIVISIWFSACNDGGSKAKEKYSSPEGYDLNVGKQLKLPPELDEISGVHYYPKDNSVFCIHDEKGFLYKVFLDSKKDLQKWRFSKSADFEDLVLLDSNFYVLKSHGDLLRFRFFSGDSLKVDTIHLPLKGSNEFEILYYDKAKQRMVLICKECEQDQKNKVSAIAYDPATNSSTTAFILQEKEIEKQLGDKKAFKASAAGVHPITNELYIISSVNKALVICDLDGNVRKVFRLDPVAFKQPEGLTFTPNGDMIVSNESADQGAANIMFYEYKKTSK